MRFATLDLRSYGPFENAPTLDLSGGQRGLHLIVGPNEAGKSTALRAIRALLFDFPHSTNDSHGRSLASLRVGGTIRDESGRELPFLRRKSGKKLWTPDDRTSLDPEALVPFLGRLDKATFETLFSTDQAELVEGGNAILAGQGRLGEMLFSAGTGLAQLDRVQKALQTEMEDLFKGGNASNPTINKTLRELKAARDDVKFTALATRDWVAADVEKQRAATAAAATARRRSEAQVELDRWQSWLGALRIIPRRQEILDRLEARSDTAALPDDFAEAYRNDLEVSRAAERAVSEARDAIRDVLAQLDQLGPADPILLESNAVERLHANLGKYASARRSRPGMIVKLGRSEEQVQTIEASLPDDLTVPDGGLPALRDQVERLGRDQTELATLRKGAETDLAQLDPTTLDPSTPITPVDPETLRWRSSLEAIIQQATEPGDLEAQRAKAAGKLATADEQALTALRGLSLWTGTLADLETLAIPPDASFDRAGEEIRAAEARARDFENDRVRLEGDRLDLIHAADLAEVAGAIPTEADLKEKRTNRDNRWRSIRRAWVDREPLAPSPAKLADDFEADLEQADALADALRHEADRVTAAAQRQIDRRVLEDRLALAIANRDQARVDHAKATQRWADLWRPLGIEPLPPSDMRDWVKERKVRLKDAKSVRDARAEVARLACQIDELREELGKALERVSEPGLADGESLKAILARGRMVKERIDKRLGRDAARGRIDEIQVKEVAWLDRWRVTVAPLGLPPETTLAAALAVLNQFAEWTEADREARSDRQTLADLALTERQFADDARALASRLVLELVPDDDSEADWEPVAAALMGRLKEADEAQTHRKHCQTRLASEQARLKKEESAVARAGESLTMLATQARCATVADVPAAIRASGEVQEDQAALKGLDERLDEFAGAMTRAGLLDALVGLDEAALTDRIADARIGLDELEADASQLNQDVGAARQKLSEMDNRPGAHEAGQVVANHQTHLAVEVERYARLKLASAVLRDAIERHREKHQGPVLDRARALFTRLTVGSFVGLQTDLNDKGEPVLRGVRGVATFGEDEANGSPASGPLLDVTSMSEGTADQLYLALRLASLSVHLDDHEPAPLVLDDILVNFDDTRARAALEVLADLSARTQVLFFTHHDHLAEIARSCLDPEVLFVHRLTTVGPIGDVTDKANDLARPAARTKRSKVGSTTQADS